ncbi:hypothetical protein FKM82_029135 [Ascaphus truei]
MALQQLSAGRSVDIFSTVHEMRLCRYLMLQTAVSMKGAEHRIGEGCVWVMWNRLYVYTHTHTHTHTHTKTSSRSRLSWH